MKRVLDFFLSFCGLVILLPVLLVFMYFVYRQDRQSPFYIAPRVGKNSTMFKMVKLRSMVSNADKSGVNSTSVDDDRITLIGHKIRRYKLDELMQLWNVLVGDMSLVGPRPNVKTETDLYTKVERELLAVKPGITDFSSIVFSDEGDILKGKKDPDLVYSQLIRPWKSRLGLIYIENQSILLDLQLIFFTIIAVFSKQRALDWVVRRLEKMQVDIEVVAVSKRERTLYPSAPPGADEIVSVR